MRYLPYIIISLLILPLIVSAQPEAYLTEEVLLNLYTNNSPMAPLSAEGWVEVSTPTADVLQYLILNLSHTTGTDLQSIVTYRSTAASPSPGDRTRIYVNTTQSEADISYNILNLSLVPIIGINMSYRNTAGGTDIHSGENLIFFNISINSTEPVPSSAFYFIISRNSSSLY